MDILDRKKKGYVLSFANLILGADLNKNDLEDDLYLYLFRALSRMEELTSFPPDRFGNWEWKFGDAHRRGELYKPWLDRQLLGVRQQLQRKYQGWKWKSPWPENREFAICLTHDVDVVNGKGHFQRFNRRLRRLPKVDSMRGHQSLLILGSLVRSVTSAGKGDALGHYEDWLRLEETYGFRSTFFFFPSRILSPHPWDCEYRFSDKVTYDKAKITVAEMMRQIDAAGWEVGLHGSYYSSFRPGLLKDQKEQIEDILKKEVRSTRQHYLHYDVKITPRLQAEAGLLTDSTQGFNTSIGFRAGTSFPYWCWDHETASSLPILEIPQHIMDGALFSVNGLEYNKELAVRHGIQLMDEVEQVGGCLTLNWHPHYLNVPDYWSVYEALLQEAARRNAWGCTAGQLYDLWTTRVESLLPIASSDVPH